MVQGDPSHDRPLDDFGEPSTPPGRRKRNSALRFVLQAVVVALALKGLVTPLTAKRTLPRKSRYKQTLPQRRSE